MGCTGSVQNNPFRQMRKFTLREIIMKIKLIAAFMIAITISPGYAMFGNPISEKVPNWTCETTINFNNGESRHYELNTMNIFHSANRTDHQWEMVGKADSTGGKLTARVYDLNGRGRTKYYSTDGKEFGHGHIECHK